MAKVLRLIESDSKTYKDKDEAEYYRNKELYAHSNLAKHREAMEKAKKACKAKKIKLKEDEELDYAFILRLPDSRPCMYQSEWSVEDAKKDYMKNEGANSKYTEDDIEVEEIQTESARLKEANIFGRETAEERKARKDSQEKGLVEDEEETTDEIVDDIQDETPTEDEEDDNILDTQLQDLRDILPDLDLSLYQVTSKEDPNKNFYFIGKVSDDSDDVLMLVDNNPSDEDDEASNIDDELPDEENIKDLSLEKTEDIAEDDENGSEDENRFDFIVIPNSYEEFIKINPRYGEELNPDHEAIMEYLMKCLVEKDPDKAEELSKEDNKVDDIDVTIEDEEDID